VSPGLTDRAAADWKARVATPAGRGDGDPGL